MLRNLNSKITASHGENIRVQAIETTGVHEYSHIEDIKY
jgi:hypothetical protein